MLTPLILALTIAAAQAPTPAMETPASKPAAPANTEQQKTPQPEKTYDPPRISIEPKGRVSLGSVGPREKKDIRYTFTNTSKAPISIRIMDLSPGVTAEGPGLQKPFNAGESQEIVVHVDPTSWVGWQPRGVKLLTDDPNQGDYRLPIAMDVRPDLTVDSPKKSFGAVAPHESPQLVFTFTRETGDPTVIKLEKDLPDYLQSEITTKGNKIELALILRARKIQPGVLRGLEPLAVTTNASLQPRFELYVDWKLALAFQPEPSRVVFLQAKDTELPLRLKAADAKPFRIIEAIVEGEGFKVGALSNSNAPEHVLTIQRTASKEARAFLVLKFEGQEETLKVPLAYLPPPPSK